MRSASRTSSGHARAHAHPSVLAWISLALPVVALGCGEGSAAKTKTGEETSETAPRESPNPNAGGADADAAKAGAAKAGSGSPVAASDDERTWVTSSAREAVSADGTYTVRWEPVGGVIPDAEPFSVAIEIERRDGRPLAKGTVVLVDAEMPHHGHGMNLVPTVGSGPRAGAFVAEGLLLHMSGRWTFAIDVEEDGLLERAQWVLDVE